MAQLNILCSLLHFKSKGINLSNLECHDQLYALSSLDALISLCQLLVQLLKI